MEDVGRQIRILLQKLPSIGERQVSLVRRAAADAEERALKKLCRKLLEYTGLVKVKKVQIFN